MILTPAKLLTQKTEYEFEFIGEFHDRDLFKVSRLLQESFGRVGRKNTFHYYRVGGSGQRVDGIFAKEM